MGRLQQIAGNIRRGARRSAPELTLALGIVGFIGTVVSACKATLTAKKKLDDLKEKCPDATTWEKAKTVIPAYIPSILLGATSCGFLVASNRISAKRIATCASAYALAEQSLKTYQEKTREVVGEEKESEIRQEVAKSKMERRPLGATEVIITGDGDNLCFDSVSGRYFKTSIEKVREVVNRLNRRMLSEHDISLTELYGELGLSQTDMSDNMGWNLDTGFIEPIFSTQLTEKGQPCLVLDYMVKPVSDAWKITY